MYRSPSVDGSRVYLYFDPIDRLPDEGRDRWEDEDEHRLMVAEALSEAGLEDLEPAASLPTASTPVWADTTAEDNHEGTHMSDDATLSLVFEVMKAHGVADRADDELVQEAYAVVEDLAERLDEARDAYDDEDVQHDALLRVVEEILLEDGLVEGPPEFLED